MCKDYAKSATNTLTFCYYYFNPYWFDIWHGWWSHLAWLVIILICIRSNPSLEDTLTCQRKCSHRLYNRCQFITGSLTLGRSDTVLSKCPMNIRMSCHWKCPLKTGFTILNVMKIYCKISALKWSSHRPWPVFNKYKNIVYLPICIPYIWLDLYQYTFFTFMWDNL